mmetsp:Transcript_130842/g.418712  ORF Transcript_130842/g.418712 Transcript_130842/m.418712 type:complete len:179 (+) Transcript_130842:211-747(+)
MEVLSSERCLAIEFSLAGRTGCYTQRTHADVSSAVWLLTKGGVMELTPNIASKLELDEVALIGCEHYTDGGARERRWADETQLGEVIGTDVVEKLGGCTPLLQFLGLICMDEGTPAAYVDALPFKLTSASFAVSESAVGNDVSSKPPAKAPRPVASSKAATAKAAVSKPHRAASQGRK